MCICIKCLYLRVAGVYFSVSQYIGIPACPTSGGQEDRP